MKTTARRWVLRAAAMLLCLAASACKVDLYNNLTEQEANEMLAALSVQRIAASKVNAGEAGWQLRVDEHELPRAVEALRARGLPHDRFVSLGDMFRKQGLVSTPAEERMRYIHGLPQELSRRLDAGQPVREPLPERPGGGFGGLGLAIAQRIAWLHGGSLRTLPSQRGGTRLCLALPLIARPRAP